MDDIEADLLRFFPQFGTDPLESIDGPRFFRLVTRLPVYGGVLTAVVEAEARREQERSGGQRGASPKTQRQGGPQMLSGLPVPADAKVVDLDTFMRESTKTMEWA